MACVPALCLLIALSIAHGHLAAQAQTLAARRPNADEPERFVEGIGRIRRSAVEKRNEFILRAPASRVAEIARRHRLTVIGQLGSKSNVFLVEGPARFGRRFDRIREDDGPALEQLVGDVRSDRDVQHFELNSAVVTPELASGLNLNQTTAAVENALADRTIVEYFGTQAWKGYVAQPAAAAIRLPASHDAGTTGAGIVAIIDTGVDPNHPLLQGSLVPGYDFITDTPGIASEWSDVDGSLVSILDGSLVSILDGSPVSILDGSLVSILDHVVPLNGSTVAILDRDSAAALDPGVLPAAFGHGTMVAGLVHLVAPTAKIMPLKAFRSDGTSTVFDVVRAIEFAVEHGARVINMSFSSTDISPEIAHAINVATSMGVVCVASAGNLGQELLVYPAALRNVLSVASTTSGTPAIRSTFSNYGAALVSLGAPGEGVITSYPGGNYAGAWGTSFSAPLAAGAAALLLQADPSLDQAKAEIALGSADRIDAGTGRGRLNLHQTVHAMVDAAAPAVTVTAPTEGGTVFGTVEVQASATDNVKIAGVIFYLDDKPLGAEDTAAPYQATWWTTESNNGSHVLKAVARDASGNQSAAAITVSVSNDIDAPKVTLTSPVDGTPLNGTVAVRATASDDHQVFGVQFAVNGQALGSEDTAEPYEAVWDTLKAVNGVHTITAIARDAAGKESTASVAVTVANDTAAPMVAIGSPVQAATVSGLVAIFAQAADDSGIASVQFHVDGAISGDADTAAPYELLWDTAGVADGAHTLSAVARDIAGNVSSAASVVVTVANAPVVPEAPPLSEPVVTAPPPPSEPVATEPPPPSEPVAAEPPPASEPVATEPPPPSEPVVTEPAPVSEPVVPPPSEPVATEPPPPSEPVAAEPPPASEPVATEPPPPSEPVATEPPPAPPSEPIATEPPPLPSEPVVPEPPPAGEPTVP
jgi:subtilisin family serine protease